MIYDDRGAGPRRRGGLVAGALDHAGTPVTLVARESTAELIAARGLRVSSVRLGDFVAHPRAVARLEEPVDALVVATKATGLHEALERIAERSSIAPPALVLPLLNGLDHLAVLRARFGEPAVVAGTIRVEADRPEPGVVVHSSPFLRIDMASAHAAARPRMEALAAKLCRRASPCAWRSPRRRCYGASWCASTRWRAPPARSTGCSAKSSPRPSCAPS